MGERHVVAMGGGGFSTESDNTRLDDFILDLTGASKPRVCFLPTPAGDDPGYARLFTETLGKRCSPSVAQLFNPSDPPVAEVVANADALYVSGGNTVNALAVWRAQGFDRVLRDAWERGVVLCGLSAGSICWFESGVTDSLVLGGGLDAFTAGLGLLPGSHCPHYDTEELRRPTYHRLIGAGALPAGYAADECAALHFVGTELREVVASRPGPAAYRVELAGSIATEERIPTRVLG